jgi:protoporphyrin/coproporphyrin ferrochelatase
VTGRLAYTSMPLNVIVSLAFPFASFMSQQDSPSDASYDAFLLVSFGGPEGPEDVMPFLENVLRGKNVPRERMLEVAEHYQHFGGVSPINEQNRALLAAIREEFAASGVRLPVYWGNRNWQPYFADALRQMRDDGCKRAIAFFTSMFSSYSGCRQYRENIAAAREEIGADAPLVDKLRMGFNHPGFIEPMAESITAAVERVQGNHQTPVLFTAHSLPQSMADRCDYEKQLREACRLVAQASGMNDWQLVFQSRSGPPQQAWLEPDVCRWIEQSDQANKLSRLVIAPIGFVSDHIEVMFDLDEEAAQLCRERGIRMARAATVGTHPRFVSMIRELVQERLSGSGERVSIGELGPWHDVCPADCCLFSRPATTLKSR